MDLLTKQDLKPLLAARPNQRDYTLKRYFHPLQKYPYLARLKTASSLIDGSKFENFLDVGFGSGIFLPELSAHTKNLFGIDIHPEIELIKKIAAKKCIPAHLIFAGVDKLPFENDFFDGILCLSVLEFVPDIKKSVFEIKRVAKKNATIIIGAPVINRLTGLLYKSIKFQNHKEVHKNGHKQIIAEIKDNFKVKKIIRYPFFMPLDNALFFIVKATK